jgi:hypothetical protein
MNAFQRRRSIMVLGESATVRAVFFPFRHLGCIDVAAPRRGVGPIKIELAPILPRSMAMISPGRIPSDTAHRSRLQPPGFCPSTHRTARGPRPGYAPLHGRNRQALLCHRDAIVVRQSPKFALETRGPFACSVPDMNSGWNANPPTPLDSEVHQAARCVASTLRFPM